MQGDRHWSRSTMHEIRARPAPSLRLSGGAIARMFRLMNEDSSETGRQDPTLSETGKARKSARDARLAAALRQNLRRRKQAQRAREDLDPAD